MDRVHRIIIVTAIAGLAAGFWPSAAAAECTTIIASTPSGATFPCTVCVEGGRPISALCTPLVLGR